MAELNVNDRQLDAVAVEAKELSTNFGEIAQDCFGLSGANLKSEIQRRFPLVVWALNTQMAREMRSKATRGFVNVQRGQDGKFVLQIPRSIWTLPFQDTSTECCWVPADFDKCAGQVPLNLLCLKDCDDIMSTLINQNLHASANDVVPGISNQGETLATINKRVARLSMAFLTAYTAVLGMDGTATPLLKPFHGMMSVLENPAVMKIDGASILAAFDELGCRMDVLGYDSDFVFAAHPLVVSAIAKEVRPDRNGNLPDDWTRSNGELRFKGARFIEDKMVPYSMADGTGEVWMMSGDSFGLFLGTDLMPADSFIKEGWGFDGQTCGTGCTYYYNYGAAFNNNANKLAVIANVPVSEACTNAIADLGYIVNPTTLIPGDMR